MPVSIINVILGTTKAAFSSLHRPRNLCTSSATDWAEENKATRTTTRTSRFQRQRNWSPRGRRRLNSF